MKIAIEAINTPDLWRLTGPVKLRIYANQSFINSDGQFVPQGIVGQANTAYLEVDCEVVASQLVIPAIEIDSTVDALTNIWATYDAELIAGGRRVPFLTSFAINTLEVDDPSTTWGEVILLRDMIAPQSIPDSLTRQLISNIQLAVGSLNKATFLNPGVTRLSVDPDDPTAPMAVSVNDPDYLAAVNAAGGVAFISSDYASLADAVLAIGATPGALLIRAADFPSGGSTTVPSTLVLDWGDVGTLDISTGHVITVQSDTSKWPRRVLWTGDGTVLFTDSLALSDLYPEWWGAVGDGVTDSTEAIQAAIDSLDASNKSGTIRLGLCTYIIAGPLRDVAESNSQLIFPRRTSAMLSINLAGYTPAPTIAFKRDLQGAVLKSTLAAGTGAIIGGKVGGGAGWPIAGTSWFAGTIENLTVRAVVNPTLTGVDLTYMPNMRVRRCQISTDQDIITAATHPPVYGITEPTNVGSYGLKLSPGNIPDQAAVEDVEIYGFHTGLLAGELCNVDNTLVVFCKVGVEIPATLHAQKFGRLYVSDCATVLKFTGGNSYVDIAQLAIEHSAASPAWASVAIDIDDPNNFGHGVVRWHISTNGAVVNDLVQTGAFYLWTESLGNLAGNHSSSPMVYVTNSANLSIPDSTFTNVTFNTDESDDPFLMHNTVSNTDLLVPTKEGIATIEFTGMFAAHATGVRQVRIYKHSALGIDILLEVQNFAAIAGVDKSVKASTKSRATNPGDYFFIQVWQNSGGALNLLSSANFSPRATLTISR